MHDNVWCDVCDRPVDDEGIEPHEHDVPRRLHERGRFTLSGNQTCTCGWVGHGKRGERIETLAGELSNHAEIPVRDSAFGYCRDCDAPITVERSRVCSYCAALKLL